jgi:deoxyribodipyrimidine photolyase-related protein
LTNDELDEYIKSTPKPYFNATFYKWIRIKKDILMHNKKPIGGKFSFDEKNRLPFEKNYEESELKFINNTYITEANKYIEKNFKNNIGESNIFLPITHKDSMKYLENFLKSKLNNFGPYEDAISSEVKIGYHSAISGLLNIGLLDVNDVITLALNYKSKVKIESLEGFIRQIISWREYVRLLYIKEHTNFNKMNFFKHSNKLSKVWYTGETGIIPVDNVIKKALQICYCHHIERLMILGNFMLLCQIKPTEVFKWFLEVVSIDAYEWVMEPNVYGMSQHSVGQLMMNRPYYSSSNYIFKMSNYKKSDKFEKIILSDEEYTWYEIFDALYYNFIDTHKIYLKGIYATANSVSIYNKKSDSEKKKLKKIAELYIKNYL